MPPKRKMSRSNTRSRRSQWKLATPAFVKRKVAGVLVYARPHRASVIIDESDSASYYEYKGRKIADV